MALQILVNEPGHPKHNTYIDLVCRGNGAVTTCGPLDGSAAVVYRATAVLPASGGLTDPQLNPLAIPAGSTYATVFATYTLGPGGDGTGGAVISVYFGAVVGHLVDAQVQLSTQLASPALTGTAFAIVPNIGGCLYIGAQCDEHYDPTHPGTLLIEVTFR
ncbi:MAG: hypothetical protein ABJE95_19570 [Byssovorax sp.]